MLRQPGLACGLMSAAVVGQGDGELLRMFYAAVPDPDSAFIMTATSRDEGLTWTKAPEPAVRRAL